MGFLCFSVGFQLRKVGVDVLTERIVTQLILWLSRLCDCLT
jgi:hypothetical protein